MIGPAPIQEQFLLDNAALNPIWAKWFDSVYQTSSNTIYPDTIIYIGGTAYKISVDGSGCIKGTAL